MLVRGIYDRKVLDESRTLAAIPAGRMGVPEEVASYVSWLASEGAGLGELVGMGPGEDLGKTSGDEEHLSQRGALRSGSSLC